MKKEDYEKAKELRDTIQHFEVKKRQISSTKERENDEDFNMLRQLAFDGCVFAIRTLENKFEEL